MANTFEGTLFNAFSTCWPIGGTAKRLVVYAKLTKIE
jgi:sortase (surface protein transpeptidase)